MTLLAGAAEADVTPPFPVDLLGYVRTRVGELVGCDPAAVLLNSGHTHAAPWPGATIKLGGEFDDWTETDRRYWDTIPDRYASAALGAVGRLAPARVSGGVGQAAGLAVNRRERTADGRTILDWNREGVRDDSVVAIRVDGLDRAPLVPDAIATLVSFACHSVVIGRDYPGAGPDFVGPLRSAVSNLLRPGAVTVFLHGAAGHALPLEAFRDGGEALGAADVFGERVALEAAHAVADAHPWAIEIDRSDWSSVTPIALYRRRLADDQTPQVLRSACRIVSLPLLELPSVADLERELEEPRADLAARADRGETRITMYPIRYHISWLETMLAHEPSVSHRGYGQPALFSPEVAGIIERTMLELLGESFA